MDGALSTALSYLGEIIRAAFGVLSGFFLQFFPDAEQSALDAISSWGSAMGGFELTFNVFYFVDVATVSVFLGLTITVMLAYLLVTMIRVVVDMAHKLIETIPVVE